MFGPSSVWQLALLNRCRQVFLAGEGDGLEGEFFQRGRRPVPKNTGQGHGVNLLSHGINLIANRDSSERV
jgi:hypothetical protein